jgi:phospholipase C
MSLTSIATRGLGAVRASLAILALEQMIFAPAIQAQSPAPPQAQTPIQHVIIIVGENRTFDHLFAT